MDVREVNKRKQSPKEIREEERMTKRREKHEQTERRTNARMGRATHRVQSQVGGQGEEDPT